MNKLSKSDLHKQLWAAAKADKAGEVARLVAAKADVDAVDGDNYKYRQVHRRLRLLFSHRSLRLLFPMGGVKRRIYFVKTGTIFPSQKFETAFFDERGQRPYIFRKSSLKLLWTCL